MVRRRGSLVLQYFAFAWIKTGFTYIFIVFVDGRCIALLFFGTLGSIDPEG